jgi:hypothetical protein
MNSALHINGERLCSSLMDLAGIGGTQRGGCTRQALTDEDKVGRDRFVAWARALGCAVSVDEVGKFAPTAMIFVPWAGGLSHNEAQEASPADWVAGANVLLHAVLTAAND